MIADALAIYRLWRLIGRDTITEDLRKRWETWVWDRARARRPPPEPGHTDPVPKLIVLVGCPWCLGFWLTFACVAWAHIEPRSWALARKVLATSALVGLVAEIEGHIVG